MKNTSLIPLIAVCFTLCGCSDTVGHDSAIPENNTAPAENTEPETEPPTSAQSHAQIKLAQMSLHQKVCQMFISTPEEVVEYAVDEVTAAGDTFRSYYEKNPVGGVIFFDINLESPEQTAEMLSNMQKIAKNNCVGLFTAIDEEGGSVTRIAEAFGGYDPGAMADISNADAAREAGKGIGESIAAYGFNLDFAPVADTDVSGQSELGDRMFSADPAKVSELSAAFVQGLHDANVCSTLKHFPGLGSASDNTHTSGAAYTERTIDELRAVDFVGFKGGIDAGTDFVMIGHHMVSAAGDDLPSDLSAVVVTDWLRGELGFTGLAVTDAQNMNTISANYSSADAAVMAVQAGIDIILMPDDLNDAINGLESAVVSGTIPESRIDESVLRILEKKDDLGLL